MKGGKVDRREVAGMTGRWFDQIDSNRMMARLSSEDVWIKISFEVCPTCDGKGSHINPSIDSHGIGAEEWAEWDHDDREAYLTGGFDVSCYQCNGRRVVPVPDDEEGRELVSEDMEARYEMAAEMEAERRYGC
jgi:hypothetical protein